MTEKKERDVPLIIFWVVVVVVAVALIFLIAWVFKVAHQQDEYVVKCEDAGGIAIGRRFAPYCIDKDVVIRIEEK